MTKNTSFFDNITNFKYNCNLYFKITYYYKIFCFNLIKYYTYFFHLKKTLNFYFQKIKLLFNYKFIYNFQTNITFLY